MRALNVLLAFLVSAVIAVLVLEVGLRLAGMGPKPTINRFDSVLGWSKTPGAVARRSSGEFDVAYRINELGLRDDPMRDPGKATGTFRVLFLGDSFVLGYTVDREDLFVDQLETWWKAEGRPVDCVNAGTEGWSTDQEVIWFQKYGRDFTPDVVVLCTYENDFYWNGQTSYFRFPKPRMTTEGEAEKRVLVAPGAEPALKRTAIGSVLLAERPHLWSPGPDLFAPAESGAWFHATPEFMEDAWARTSGALATLKREVEGRGARLVVAPIPNKACIHEDARAVLVDQIARRDWLSQLRRWVKSKPEPEAVAPDKWSPDEPVDRVLALCKDLAIDAVDARPALKSAAATDGELYYASDWHFNPAGNRAFAHFLHGELDRVGAFPAGLEAKTSAPPPAPRSTPFLRTWMIVFAALWAALSIVWRLTYPKDATWRGPAVCGGMLALVFTIVLGGQWAIGHLSPAIGKWLAVLFIAVIVSFLLIKLGKRLGTVFELLWCFTLRGHWYLMPLVVVLLTVGSLLVVAASSPLVAPFIYTLF